MLVEIVNAPLEFEPANPLLLATDTPDRIVLLAVQLVLVPSVVKYFPLLPESDAIEIGLPLITPLVIVIVVPSTLTPPSTVVLAVGSEYAADQLAVVPFVVNTYPFNPEDCAGSTFN